MEVTSNWSGGCFYGFETVLSSIHDAGKYSIQLCGLVYQLKTPGSLQIRFCEEKGARHNISLPMFHSPTW